MLKAVGVFVLVLYMGGGEYEYQETEYPFESMEDCLNWKYQQELVPQYPYLRNEVARGYYCEPEVEA